MTRRLPRHSTVAAQLATINQAATITTDRLAELRRVAIGGGPGSEEAFEAFELLAEAAQKVHRLLYLFAYVDAVAARRRTA